MDVIKNLLRDSRLGKQPTSLLSQCQTDVTDLESRTLSLTTSSQFSKDAINRLPLSATSQTLHMVETLKNQCHAIRNMHDELQLGGSCIHGADKGLDCVICLKRSGKLMGNFVNSPPGLDVIDFRLVELEKHHRHLNMETLSMERDRVSATLGEILESTKRIAGMLDKAENRIRKRIKAMTTIAAPVVKRQQQQPSVEGDGAPISLVQVKHSLGFNESVLQATHDDLNAETKEAEVVVHVKFIVEDVTVDREHVSSHEVDVLDELVQGVCQDIFTSTGRKVSNDVRWETLSHTAIDLVNTHVAMLTNHCTLSVVARCGKGGKLFDSLEPVKNCLTRFLHGKVVEDQNTVLDAIKQVDCKLMVNNVWPNPSTMEFLLRAMRYQNITHLELVNCPTLDLSCNLALALNTLLELHTVDVSTTTIKTTSNNNPASFFDYVQCPKLAYLDLSGHVMTAQDTPRALQLFLSRHTCTLRTLLMNGCVGVTDASNDDELDINGQLINAVISAVTLTRISFAGIVMPNSECTSKFLQALLGGTCQDVNIAECRTMFPTLDYDGTQEADYGIGRAIAYMAWPSSSESIHLQSLCLSGCRIKDAGLSCLAMQGLGNGHLASLRVLKAANVGAVLGSGVIDILTHLRYAPMIEHVSVGFNFKSRFESSDGVGGDPLEMSGKFSMAIRELHDTPLLRMLELHGVCVDVTMPLVLGATNVSTLCLGAVDCSLDWVSNAFRVHGALNKVHFWGNAQMFMENGDDNDFIRIERPHQTICNVMRK